MRVLELFAGAGGGILGGMLLGHRCIAAVENEPYCQQVLMARQADGALPWFPIYGDIREFDGRPYRGVVDIVSGGFPCTNISPAGDRAGIDGGESRLWWEFVRVVREVRPLFWFVENSSDLTVRGLSAVLGSMAKLRYHAAWGVLGACSVGAWHHRARMWILATDSTSAHTDDCRQHDEPVDVEVASLCPHANASDTNRQRSTARPRRAGEERDGRTVSGGGSWWADEPALARVAYGMADRVGQVGALGNGQVPAVHALAFRILYSRLMGEHS
jgi:DNA (cytosine-5)-methyltransferase 1